MNKTDAKKTVDSLGVLYTGYLDKRNPVTGAFKKRFVVLTHDSLHWFLRADGYDLFGEERGNVPLSDIITTRMLDEDTTTFEIQGTDMKKRLFRAATPVFCEEWVSAIRSAIKRLANSQQRRNSTVGPRRASLAGIRNIFEDNDDQLTESYDKSEVMVMLVSLSSPKHKSEMVIARNPDWERVISVPMIRPGDELILSISNGGTVKLTSDQLMDKAEDGMEFEVGVQNVPLASSIRLSVRKYFDDDGITSDSKQRTKLEQLMQLFISLTKERTSAINMVLSMMVIVVGITSLRALGADTSLLFLFACLLSLYNLNLIISGAKSDVKESQIANSLNIILHGHAFTSPDAPINTPEDEIPQRFIDGCEGDLKEARKRWDVTRHWREQEVRINCYLLGSIVSKMSEWLLLSIDNLVVNLRPHNFSFS